MNRDGSLDLSMPHQNPVAHVQVAQVREGEGGREGGRGGRENQRVKLRERKDAPKELDPFLARSALLPLGGYRSRGRSRRLHGNKPLPRNPEFFFFYHYVL